MRILILAILLIIALTYYFYKKKTKIRVKEIKSEKKVIK